MSASGPTRFGHSGGGLAFALTGVAPGAHSLVVTMTGYLGQTTSFVATSGVTVTVATLRLFGGDAVGDGQIDIYDLTVVGAAFGAAVPSEGRTDINGDGVANIFDIVLVGANYGRWAALP